jgi:hypothetical protein
MGGPNDIGTGNSIQGVDVVQVLADGTMLTSGGAEVHDAQTINDAQMIETEKLGYSYDLSHIGDIDYGSYDKSLTVTSDPSSPNILSVTDGQNTDTLDLSHGAEWLVGSNNGDTFDLGPESPFVWLGSGDNTVNSDNGCVLVHTDGNDVVNDGPDSDKSSNLIMLAPGITPDEVDISFANVNSTSLDVILTIAGHGSVALNNIAYTVNPDNTLHVSPSLTIEFLGTNFSIVDGNQTTAEFIQNLHTGTVQLADLASDSHFFPTAPLPGEETLTADAANGYQIMAGSGDKIIQGDANHFNTLFGGTGDDTIIGGNAGNLINAQFGNDNDQYGFLHRSGLLRLGRLYGQSRSWPWIRLHATGRPDHQLWLRI